MYMAKPTLGDSFDVNGSEVPFGSKSKETRMFLPDYLSWYQKAPYELPKEGIN